MAAEGSDQGPAAAGVPAGTVGRISLLAGVVGAAGGASVAFSSFNPVLATAVSSGLASAVGVGAFFGIKGALSAATPVDSVESSVVAGSIVFALAALRHRPAPLKLLLRTYLGGALGGGSHIAYDWLQSRRFARSLELRAAYARELRTRRGIAGMSEDERVFLEYIEQRDRELAAARARGYLPDWLPFRRSRGEGDEEQAK